ncbi:MAG TPA: DUF6599 family protein [Pyrinomonadaceae bacterium]|nr:DUF6599 family protein [Pyrinomonadaceae bacterium]
MPRLIAKLFLTAALIATIFAPARAQQAVPDSAAALLPDQLGEFRAQGAAQTPERGLFAHVVPEAYGIASQARRRYVSDDGRAFGVSLVRTRGDSGAYSFLTNVGAQLYGSPSTDVEFGEVGTASVAGPNGVAFFKGPVFVGVSAEGGETRAEDDAPARLARRLAETLDAGEGGPPVLALHLPEWEKVSGWAGYATSLQVLQESVGGARPVLEAVSFDGGAEAATATYGQSRLVVVEFTTPQYAQDSDARINERIAQLRAEGRPVPSAYRRVGNYSVFVFDAEGEQEAASLVEQVKYEKDVRWLGENPNELARMQERYQSTMGGVIVATLKATGLAILLCLGVGGLFGGFVFLRRRTRSAASEAFSDAGGMLRLNIEDVNAPHGRPRLVGDGEK